MKHVELDLHFIRELIEEGFIITPHVSTHLQLVDLFTKPKSYQHMDPFLAKMNMTSINTFLAWWGWYNSSWKYPLIAFAIQWPTCQIVVGLVANCNRFAELDLAVEF